MIVEGVMLKGPTATRWSFGTLDWSQKVTANRLVHLAIKSGEVVREPCVICGNNKVVGHHEQYDRPLEVVWLCHACHGRRHRGFSYDEMREAVNA